VLKQTVKYLDFDGTAKERTLCFHMTDIEIAKALLSEEGGLENRFKNALGSADQRRFVVVFDELVRLSIGKLDDDMGFTKTKAYTDWFMSSEAYSQMWKDIMADAKLAVAFFNGIFPKKVLDKAREELMARQGEPGVPTVDKDAMAMFDLAEKQPANAEEPKAQKPGHEYTLAELQAMTDAEFSAWESRTPARTMQEHQLKFAYMRRSKA
jgi:hypothetical protein